MLLCSVGQWSVQLGIDNKGAVSVIHQINYEIKQVFSSTNSVPEVARFVCLDLVLAFLV